MPAFKVILSEHASPRWDHGSGDAVVADGPRGAAVKAIRQAGLDTGSEVFAEVAPYKTNFRDDGTPFLVFRYTLRIGQPAAQHEGSTK